MFFGEILHSGTSLWHPVLGDIDNRDHRWVSLSLLSVFRGFDPRILVDIYPHSDEKRVRHLKNGAVFIWEREALFPFCLVTFYEIKKSVMHQLELKESEKIGFLVGNQFDLSFSNFQDCSDFVSIKETTTIKKERPTTPKKDRFIPRRSKRIRKMTTKFDFSPSPFQKKKQKKI